MSNNAFLQEPSQRPANASRYSPAPHSPLKRPRTPTITEDGTLPGTAGSVAGDKELTAGEERRQSLMKDLYARSERIIAGLFKSDSSLSGEGTEQPVASREQDNRVPVDAAQPSVTPKRQARPIDEDDYGDDDDEDDEPSEQTSPLQGKDQSIPKANGAQSTAISTPTLKPPLDRRSTASSHEQTKSTEEVLKKLESEKKAAEDAAKESFQSMFYTLENDRDAMLEQQKLDELDRQVETEMSGQEGGNTNASRQRGTLSSTNLGASSLTLKHLIARIDVKRDRVRASDMQLRSLMSEVRKNRSKWASEDKVGQEELYEAADKVLMELKAMTEYAAPFLQKVNKREAPDYHNIIKNPMDIGSMLKKLKQLQYKSKKEFVEDLDLIWANCLKYNTDTNHPLRKKAEHMRKETAKLTPLIPDIVVRDRAEVEAEERRQQMSEFGEDDDSDEEPIIASRGRKAPTKGSKKGTSTTRKAPPAPDEATPGPETRAPNSAHGSLGPFLKSEHLRSDADTATESGSQHGGSTPPPGNLTPVGPNGLSRAGAPQSHADASELEEMGASVIGGGFGHPEDLDQEDDEYKTWKAVTKKDRAQVASERHRMFKGDRINPEEPALLRSKARMRKFMRQQKAMQGPKDATGGQYDTTTQAATASEGATLAEGIEGEDDYVLPDYYDPLSGIPQLDDRLKWQEDSDGQVIEQMEECLRLIPPGHFIAPKGALASKIQSNMKQMQDTRKVVAKIGIVKQMQIQTQTYQNQFQKYEPEPFTEADAVPFVVSDDGPVMAPGVCRAALQRSVGEIFYHAGFEDFQPSALETITDVTAQYMQTLSHNLGIYGEMPKVWSTPQESPPTKQTSKDSTVPPTVKSPEATAQRVLVPRFTPEEQILHALHATGVDLDSLEAYIKEDVDRLTTKLETYHYRVKDYLAELLRPALDPTQAGPDGAGAFQEGSEQFVGGDILVEDADEDFFGFRELGLDREFGLTSLSVPLHLLQSRVHNAYQPANANAASATGNVMEPPPIYPALTSESLEDQIGIVKDFFRKKLEEAPEGEALVEDEDLPAKQRFPKPRLPPTGKITSPRKRPIREQQMMARKKRKLEAEELKEKEEAANATTTQDEPSGPTAPMVNGHSVPSNGADGVSTSNPTSATENDNSGAVMLDALPNGTSHPGGNSDQHTSKPVSKLKLEAPNDESGATGDPEKQASKATENEDDTGGGGKEEDDDDAESKDDDDNGKGKKKSANNGESASNGDANGDKEHTGGMATPESLPIAAH